MRVRYTLRASRDLAAILLYLAKHSPQGMRNVKRAIHIGDGRRKPWRGE